MEWNEGLVRRLIERSALFTQKAVVALYHRHVNGNPVYLMKDQRFLVSLAEQVIGKNKASKPLTNPQLASARPLLASYYSVLVDIAKERGAAPNIGALRFAYRTGNPAIDTTLEEVFEKAALHA